MNRIIERVNKVFSIVLAFCTIAASLSYAEDIAPVDAQPVQVSTTVVAVQQVEPAVKKTDDRQLYSAISDLNYKIEYLQSNYNRLNVDIENLRIADRDQKKIFNDRISALPMPDISRIENLETTSALMRSEISQIRADIAEIKGRSDYRGQVNISRDNNEKVLRSPWIAVAALGIALIALIKK